MVSADAQTNRQTQKTYSNLTTSWMERCSSHICHFGVELYFLSSVTRCSDFRGNDSHEREVCCVRRDGSTERYRCTYIVCVLCALVWIPAGIKPNLDRICYISAGCFSFCRVCYEGNVCASVSCRSDPHGGPWAGGARVWLLALHIQDEVPGLSLQVCADTCTGHLYQFPYPHSQAIMGMRQLVARVHTTRLGIQVFS